MSNPIAAHTMVDAAIKAAQPHIEEIAKNVAQTADTIIKEAKMPHPYKYPLCVIDVETTGLDKDLHEIISFCGIKYDPRTRTEHMLDVKIKPVRPHVIDPYAAKINGYNESDWENANHPASIAPVIRDFLNGCMVIGHNVTFDLKFLHAFFNQKGFSDPLIYRHIDTVTLAHEHLVPCGLKSLSLDSIRHFLGMRVYKHHTARQDAKDCLRIYKTLIRCGKLKRAFWTLRHKIKNDEE